MATVVDVAVVAMLPPPPPIRLAVLKVLTQVQHINKALLNCTMLIAAYGSSNT